MFSTSISSVLFTLLIILQTLATALVLPTSTTIASTDAQLETREDPDSTTVATPVSHSGSNTTTSNKVTPAQIAGVVIGALCTIALALIFWYCFVQHRRRKQELRDMQEKAAAIENTKRADPSYEYARSIDARSGA
ncbi:hypothetical protein B9Z19DRAFT_1098535 [Tuber borchii]|uniref:Mid2 domain-containing protein n=1 Tax=Tuber borchii TaxID=42251 RepID=A0A2T7A7K5_TUBBO|nr:hypothetical protein B9Z19DRAFT_1098535 [Tuber borchii]